MRSLAQTGVSKARLAGVWVDPGAEFFLSQTCWRRPNEKALPGAPHLRGGGSSWLSRTPRVPMCQRRGQVWFAAVGLEGERW